MSSVKYTAPSQEERVPSPQLGGKHNSGSSLGSNGSASASITSSPHGAADGGGNGANEIALPRASRSKSVTFNGPLPTVPGASQSPVVPMAPNRGQFPRPASGGASTSVATRAAASVAAFVAQRSMVASTSESGTDDDDSGSSDTDNEDGTHSQGHKASNGTFVDELSVDIVEIMSKHNLGTAKALVELIRRYTREIDAYARHHRTTPSAAASHKSSVRSQAHSPELQAQQQQQLPGQDPSGDALGMSVVSLGSQAGAAAAVVVAAAAAEQGPPPPLGNENPGGSSPHMLFAPRLIKEGAREWMSSLSPVAIAAIESEGGLSTSTDSCEEEMRPFSSCGGDDEASPSLFSFRQLSTWKFAVQRSRERNEAAQREDLRARHQDSIFSEDPLEKDDYAELLADRIAYATPEQIKADKIVNWYRKYARMVQFLFIVLMFYEFGSVTIRAFMEVPRTDVSYPIELIILEVPLTLYALSNIFRLHEDKGILKVNFAKGAREYLLSLDFVLDLCGILPLEAIGRVLGDTCTDHVLDCGFVSPYWHLNKLLLVRDMFARLDAWLDNSEGIHPTVGRMLSQFARFCAFAHIVSAWMNIMIASDPGVERIWLLDRQYFNRTISDKYFVGLDWSTKSLVGFTKGNPFNNPDKIILFTLAVSMCGIVAFTTFIGAISAYLGRRTAVSQALQKIDEVIDECSYRNLPASFLHQAIDFHWHKYKSTQNSENVVEILEDLPKSLQIRILSNIGATMARQVPLLAPYATDQTFVLCLAISLTPVVLMPYTTYFKKGERGNSMAFITWGSMGVVPIDFDPNNPAKNTVLFKLNRGSFFGEIALILGLRRTATMSSLSEYTNLMELRKDNFLQLQRDFPEVIAEMKVQANERYRQLNQKATGDKEERTQKLAEAVDKVYLLSIFEGWMKLTVARHANLREATAVFIAPGQVDDRDSQQAQQHDQQPRRLDRHTSLMLPPHERTLSISEAADIGSSSLPPNPDAGATRGEQPSDSARKRRMSATSIALGARHPSVFDVRESSVSDPTGILGDDGRDGEVPTAKVTPPQRAVDPLRRPTNPSVPLSHLLVD